jgi:hypothetical protein
MRGFYCKYTVFYLLVLFSGIKLPVDFGIRLLMEAGSAFTSLILEPEDQFGGRKVELGSIERWQSSGVSIVPR